MREIERATNRVAHFVMQSHLRAAEAHGAQPRAVLGCSPSAQRLWGLLDLQQCAGKVPDAFRCVVLDQGVGFFGVQTFDCGWGWLVQIHMLQRVRLATHQHERSH